MYVCNVYAVYNKDMNNYIQYMGTCNIHYVWYILKLIGAFDPWYGERLPLSGIITLWTTIKD